ncbi:hypothetical protein ASE75_04480 [Sphingomonas sp. Leaf17]|uniref:ImuA family protein n=1 Tax=Sphingomonas sp. Leaf17 TaxID=1735683 RepID=UPI0006F22FBA|nr:hypothetical protein [Sphingomonas sp. Leaf17]KQM65525.1 hypothetical protein ASE75_04480 [Sphingomonas sp. Leaf17]
MPESTVPPDRVRPDHLRRAIAGMEGARDATDLFASGHPDMDAWLGGGLARGRMHEIHGDAADEAGAAMTFAALLAARADRGANALLWLRSDTAERRSGRLYAPGLAELGIDPARLVLGVVEDDTALLRSALDGARCGGLGAIILECWDNPRLFDLTASRRLVLAAEASGVTILLLRIAGVPTANAADTRWRIRAAPSTPLPANAPGPPVFLVELLRRRAGTPGGPWALEWNRDDRIFRAPALPGSLVRLPAGRSLASSPVVRLRRTG